MTLGWRFDAGFVGWGCLLCPWDLGMLALFPHRNLRQTASRRRKVVFSWYLSNSWIYAGYDKYLVYSEGKPNPLKHELLFFRASCYKLQFGGDSFHKFHCQFYWCQLDLQSEGVKVIEGVASVNKIRKGNPIMALKVVERFWSKVQFLKN